MSDDQANAIDTITAAVQAVFDDLPEGAPSGVVATNVHRFLHEAGWLRTAEDRAVLQTADVETIAEDEFWTAETLEEMRGERRRAVRARRVAAGGTEAPA